MTPEKLRSDHLPGVAALELLCFPDEPWSEQSLALLCRENAVGEVITDEDGGVIAYGGMTFAAGEASVTNIATHPAYRRRGMGLAVVSALIRDAAALGLAEIYLEVRPSNVPAIALYRALGFEDAGIRKSFYRFPREDALVMKKALLGV